MELSCGAAVSVQTSGAGACVAFAKEELMAHLLKMFTKINFTDKLPEIRILLSVRKSPMLRYDGYQVVITEKQVHISAAEPRGVLHGVYHFLRMLGCSFWFSKTAVQNVPTVRRKELPTGVFVENPIVKTRGIALFGTTAKSVADVLATIDFMAKNNYNLLLTTPDYDEAKLCKEHAIKWDEISDTVLPHLIKRGIDICMGLSEKIPGVTELSAKEYGKASRERVELWADEIVAYLEDKPYITMLGPWNARGECGKGCMSVDSIHEKNAAFAQRIHKALPHMKLLHTACGSVCPSCPEGGMPKNVSALLTEEQNAFEWSQNREGGAGTYLLDRAMGDSYRWQTNLWLQPHHAKHLVAAAANACCDGVISIWSPISSWRIASINFAFLREAYYHPDFSVFSVCNELCTDLWDVAAPTMFKALMLTISDIQDPALWSRPPRCPERINGHTYKRNKIFDEQNAQTMLSRHNEILEIINSINIDRLYEHGRYHLDFIRYYLDLQLEFFKCIDQFNSETDTSEKAEAYFKLLALAFEKTGEGFVPSEYARAVMKKIKMLE